jgi:hypothetical protein
MADEEPRPTFNTDEFLAGLQKVQEGHQDGMGNLRPEFRQEEIRNQFSKLSLFGRKLEEGGRLEEAVDILKGRFSTPEDREFIRELMVKGKTLSKYLHLVEETNE